MRIKRAIVNGLEWACGRLDNVPWVRRSDDSWRSLKFYRHSLIGCHPFGLTMLAINLDDKWGTGIWDGPGTSEGNEG